MARRGRGGCSPGGQKERDSVLPVEMERLLCAPDGGPSAKTRDKETGGEGRLADGWPEANAPLIGLLSLHFLVSSLYFLSKNNKKMGEKPLKRTKNDKNPAQKRRWILFL